MNFSSIIPFYLAFCSLIFSQQYSLSENEVYYEFEFMTKDIKGVSKKAKGMGNCTQDSCQFIVAVPVKSFESGNTNRDINMWESTRAEQHPLVKVQTEFILPGNNAELELMATIDFAGQKQNKAVPVQVQFMENAVTVSGNFDFLLSDFRIKRPSLLLLKIPDKINLVFNLSYRKHQP